MIKVSADPNDTMAQTLRARSGSVNTTDPLVAFLYVLLRDHVQPADVEYVMKQVSLEHGIMLQLGDVETQEFQLSNGWLGCYAKDIAARLRAPNK